MNVTKNTHDKIQKLFDKFSYQYDFKWEDVAEIFKVKKSRASEVIGLLLDSNLIEQSDPTKKIMIHNQIEMKKGKMIII